MSDGIISPNIWSTDYIFPHISHVCWLKFDLNNSRVPRTGARKVNSLIAAAWRFSVTGAGTWLEKPPNEMSNGGFSGKMGKLLENSSINVVHWGFSMIFGSKNIRRFMAGKAIELSVKSIQKHGNSQQAMFDYRRVYVDIHSFAIQIARTEVLFTSEQGHIFAGYPLRPCIGLFFLVGTYSCRLGGLDKP